jgi:hypothetical protein
VRVEVRNARWAGVPFTLRSGRPWRQAGEGRRRPASRAPPAAGVHRRCERCRPALRTPGRTSSRWRSRSMGVTSRSPCTVRRSRPTSASARTPRTRRFSPRSSTATPCWPCAATPPRSAGASSSPSATRVAAWRRAHGRLPGRIGRSRQVGRFLSHLQRYSVSGRPRVP